MNLRIDLLEHLMDEEILEAVKESNHRYKPEPLFSKTGTGSLSSASTEERAKEGEQGTDLIAKLVQRVDGAGKPSDKAS